MDSSCARTVLVVEDNRETRLWICDTLRRHFDTCKVLAADSLLAAERILDECEERGLVIDLALIDIGLPDGNGIALIRRLSLRCPATLPVVVTIFDDDATLFDALAAGARGYVLKGVQSKSLIEQLRRIERGEPPISPQIAHRILAYFRSKPAPPSAAPPALAESEQLTQREVEILGFLGKGLTATDIGGVLGITRNTCSTHIKSIYRKLGISNRAEAALEASRRGLI